MERLAYTIGVSDMIRSGKLVMSDNPTLTTGDNWQLTHPAQYGSSPLVTPGYIADLEQQHVVAGHAHHWGYGQVPFRQVHGDRGRRTVRAAQHALHPAPTEQASRTVQRLCHSRARHPAPGRRGRHLSNDRDLSNESVNRLRGTSARCWRFHQAPSSPTPRPPASILVRDKLVLVQLYQTGLAEPILIDWRKSWPSWADLLSNVFASICWSLTTPSSIWECSGQTGSEFGQVFCTQVAEQVLRGVGLEDARVQGIEVSLAGLAKTYGVRTTPLSKAEREWFYTTLPLDIEQEIPEAQLAYAAEDVKVLADIYEAQQAELELRDDRGATDLRPVLALEMRVLPALVDVELAGIRIDVEGWRAFIADKAVEAKGHEDKVLETFGEPILSERIRQYDADMVAFEALGGCRRSEIPRTVKAEYNGTVRGKPEHRSRYRVGRFQSSSDAKLAQAPPTTRPAQARHHAAQCWRRQRSSSRHSGSWVSRSRRLTPSSSRRTSTTIRPSAP